MTSDELAIRIKAGERELIPQLWEQVKRLVAFFMTRWSIIYTLSKPVDFDDYMQSGYIAMMDAVEHYDPAKGAFNTILKYYLKNAFRHEAGIRTRKQRNDALRYAYSLYIPTEDEDDSIPMLEIIEDEQASMEFERRELHRLLDALLAKLPKVQRTAIIEKYYYGYVNVSEKIVSDGLRRLRLLPLTCQLAVYL